MDALVTRPKLLRPTLAELKAAIEAGEPASWVDVLVTPAMMKLMLQYNRPGETNRRLSADYVARQSDEITAGRWENTGEPIIFSDARSTDGPLLNDGQHRLNSGIKAGVSLVMDIRFGVPRHAVYNTNSGMKRSPAHALQIAGISASALHGAIVRMVTAYETGGLPTMLWKVRVNNGQIVDRIVSDNRFLVAGRLSAGCPRYVNNSAVASVLYLGLCTANAATVGEFAEVLQFGGGSVSNPPHRLRERLLVLGGQYSTEQRAAVFANCIQAWNAFKSGTAIGRWWKAPEPFPLVESYRTQPR